MPPSPVRMVPIGLLCLGLAALVPSSRAISVSEVVKAFCLSAYQADLQKEGRSVSPALLDRTCGCVGEQVALGSDVEDAHAVCARPQGAALKNAPHNNTSGPDAGHVSHTQTGQLGHGDPFHSGNQRGLDVQPFTGHKALQQVETILGSQLAILAPGEAPGDRGRHHGVAVDQGLLTMGQYRGSPDEVQSLFRTSLRFFAKRQAGLGHPW
jgi:hypothetical protein